MKSFAFLFALALSLSSCTPIYTQEYLDLEPHVDKAPQSDAVVGMWNRKSRSVFGEKLSSEEIGSGSTSVNNSILFRSDNTGITKYTNDDPDPVLGWLGTGDLPGEIGPFTWAYAGNGVWTMKNAKGRIDECRMANGKLLRKFHYLGPNYLVYERVD